MFIATGLLFTLVRLAEYVGLKVMKLKMPSNQS